MERAKRVSDMVVRTWAKCERVDDGVEKALFAVLSYLVSVVCKLS